MKVSLRKRKSSNGKTRLFLEIYIDRNNRRYESLGLSYDRYTTTENRKTILEAANKRKSERESEIIISGFGLDVIKRKDGSFFEYFEQINKAKKENGNNNHNYTAVLIHLRDFANGKDCSFKEVDENYIDRFKDYLLTKVKVNTVNNYLNKLSAVVHKAIRENIISVNPMRGMNRPQKEEVERVYLTEEEIQILFNTPCHYSEVKRAFLFSCFTGLRFCDVKKLTWKEIRDDKVNFRQKKTGGFEYVPLSATAKNILFADNNNKIIPLPIAKVFKLPVNHRTNSALLMWATKAKIDKHITFHTSRHTFATLALTKGADLYTVSKLLGHKDISTTQIYAKIVNEKLDEAMKLLPSFNIS